MKALLIAICVAGLLLLAGCGDDGGNVDVGNNGNNGAGGNGGGGGNANNLQTFVLANCGAVTSGEPVPTNGSSFPANSQTDPTQSVYSENCLSDVN